MVTVGGLASAAPFLVALKMEGPGELVASVIVSADVVRLPRASCSVTVTVEPALFDAVAEIAAEVKTSFAAGAALTTTDAAEVGVRLPSTAVTEYVPALLKLQPENWTMP